VSIVLFVITGTAATAAIANSVKATNVSRSRVTAANIAQDDIDQVRALVAPYYPAATTYSAPNHPSFTVARTRTGTCPAEGGADQYIDVTVIVSWPVSGGGTKSVRSDTRLAC